MAAFKYTCIYNDAEGESHFRNEEIEFLKDGSRVPALMKASANESATHYTFLSGASGWVFDWHTTPQPCFIFLLAGQLDITTSDGETRTFRVGDITLCEDATGKGHLGRGVGSTDVLMAAVYI
jgi:hypothetical protein